MPLEGNGLYKLEYLPVARKDMIEIVRYISRELQNPDAADRLAVELVNAAECADFSVCCSGLPADPVTET